MYFLHFDSIYINILAYFYLNYITLSFFDLQSDDFWLISLSLFFIDEFSKVIS